MWWRLVGSAVEHAAKLAGNELDFQNLFIAQEEDDEESVSLADMLEILVKKWPGGQFTATAVAGMINGWNPSEDGQTIREFLLPGAVPGHVFSGKTISKLLKKHLDGPVRSGERTLVLRRQLHAHSKVFVYQIESLKQGG